MTLVAVAKAIAAVKGLRLLFPPGRPPPRLRRLGGRPGAEATMVVAAVAAAVAAVAAVAVVE